MDKCCSYAIRLSTGVTSIFGAVISLLLAYNLHASGTALSAWNGMADNDKVLYIKLIVLGGLALMYGIASLAHRSSRLGAYIPSVSGLLFLAVCAVSLSELLAFFIVGAIMTGLSIATFFEHEVPVMRWEQDSIFDEAELTLGL